MRGQKHLFLFPSLLLIAGIFAGPAISNTVESPQIYLSRTLHGGGSEGFELKCLRLPRKKSTSCTLDRMRNGNAIGTKNIPIAKAQTILKNFFEKLPNGKLEPVSPAHVGTFTRSEDPGLNWMAVGPEQFTRGTLPTPSRTATGSAERQMLWAVLELENRFSREARR